MKKTFFITALLVCLFNLNAQVKIKPGIKTGINIANISNSPTESVITESIQDFYVGAYVQFRFSDLYALQPEIIYSQQGFKAKGTNNNGININPKIELNYVSISVANKFFAKNTGLNFIIGPSIDIKVNNIPNYFNNYNFDETDDYAGLDFALFGGIGYEFPFGLGIEARYKQGLVDINGDNFNQSVSFDELNVNQVFQLGLTYSF